MVKKDLGHIKNSLLDEIACLEKIDKNNIDDMKRISFDLKGVRIKSNEGQKLCNFLKNNMYSKDLLKRDIELFAHNINQANGEAAEQSAKINLLQERQKKFDDHVFEVENNFKSMYEKVQKLCIVFAKKCFK